MGLIFRLSLRNLFRQKRRNLLLGIGISFGMMILVVANSFSHGLVDVLINDIVAKSFGHLVIQGIQGNSGYYSMIRDKQRIMKIIKDNVPAKDLVRVNENLGMFGRAIGNGEADNLVVAGVTLTTAKEKKGFFNGFFTLSAGNYNDFYRKDIEYPVIISVDKAKSLKVKLHDVIRVRMPMVTGQIQAARLTVIAIANSNNTLMNLIAFMDGDRVKKLLGYKPWESASLQMTLRDPKRTAKYYADILHRKLQPEILSLIGKAGTEECRLFAFKNEAYAKERLRKQIRIVSGDQQQGFDKDGVMITSGLARKLKLKVGDEFSYEYQTKFRGLYQENFKVDTIYQSGTKLGGNIILVNGERIYDTYNKFLPKDPGPKERDPEFIKKTDPIFPVLATEWKLLNRSKDSDQLQRQLKRERSFQTQQAKFNVVTMYEGASDILKLEGVLNLITIIAVLLLFFIILVGVINTLRMTIKERTREIGTIRAIGMQKKDIRNLFIMETLLLAVFSCLAGILAGIIVIWILGTISFNIDNALSMILKEKHLNFKLDFAGILLNLIIIMFISGVTAYFPARRAAKLSAVEALRHYE